MSDHYPKPECQDCTLRIKLEDSRKKYQELIENINSGIALYETTDDGTTFVVKDFNAAAERICNRTKKEVINKEATKAFPGLEQMGLLAIFRNVYDTEESEFHPKLYYSDDELKGWFKNFVYKLSSGEIIVIFDDITERIVTEDILMAAKEKAEESDRLKTAFLANMSHEIRTPMNAIVGFSDLIAHLPTDTPIEERDEYVQHITKSTDTLLHLIDDIIDIAKIEAGQLKIKHDDKCYINNMLDDIKHEAISKLETDEIEIILKKNIPYEDFSIRTDQHRLKQILANLVSNAIKFTEKGSITIGYEIKEYEIQFYVQDTGIGIPNDELEYVFDRFRQVEIQKDDKLYGGIGLGLNIGKSLSKLLGGDMWVESELDVGTKFTFTVPLNGLSTKKKITKRSKKNEIINGNFYWPDKTVLIAEDDKLNTLYLQEVLKRSEITTMTAPNGQVAIDIYKEHWDKIDVVLLDVKMPKIDGYEVCKLIREIHPEIPIIIQTAHAISGEKEKAFELGCDEYLTKPLRATTLLKTMKKYLK